MPKLFGKEYTRDQLMQRVGRIEQVAGVERMVLAEGNSTGVEAFRFRTGGGLDFSVLASRGMDIGAASYRETPLAWESSTGPAHPSQFEPEDLGWLKTFHGGLFCTCGLTYAGAPGPDGDDNLGLHGQISHIQAGHVSSGAGWSGDQYIMYAEGEMRETTVFGPNVVMKRTVTAVMGEPELRVTDVVRNDGFKPQEHMILYHCNLGFPVMDADTELVTPRETIEGRDPYSQDTISRASRFAVPDPAVDERVYYHELTADAGGMTTVALVNRGLGDGLAVSFTWDINALPFLSQWKFSGQGTYVTGIEPGNCHVTGRASERDRGTLQVLEPGEERTYEITMGVADGKREIDGLLKRIKAI